MNIWKFPLAIADLQRVEVPKGSLVLTAQAQAGRLCLWAVVPANHAPGKPTEKIVIEIIGTGHPEEEVPRSYIATVQLSGDVWHVFQRTEHGKAIAMDGGD